MNDKSLLSRYHQGDVYIVKDKKPTPGTTGEHPYLIISNDGAEVIYTVPISSAYTDYLPIHSRDKEGNVCYTYLNPFKMYPITCSQMDAHAVFAYRVSSLNCSTCKRYSTSRCCSVRSATSALVCSTSRSAVRRLTSSRRTSILWSRSAMVRLSVFICSL